jgi:hypothetical protein
MLILEEVVNKRADLPSTSRLNRLYSKDFYFSASNNVSINFLTKGRNNFNLLSTVKVSINSRLGGETTRTKAMMVALAETNKSVVIPVIMDYSALVIKTFSFQSTDWFFEPPLHTQGKDASLCISAMLKPRSSHPC